MYTRGSHTSEATHLDVYGIPDRTIGLLLDSIAVKKGNNITVILDCCHSGSGTRDFGTIHPDLADAVPRGVGAVTIPEDLDSELNSAAECLRGRGPSAISLKQGSHILLSACRAEEKSWESRGRGVFTKALLSALREVSLDNPITYLDLLDRIAFFMTRPSIQNPQCEGLQRDRYIFQTKRAMRGSVFKVDYGENGYVMHAGEGHGITEGAEFDLRSYNKGEISLTSLYSSHPSHLKTFLANLDVPADRGNLLQPSSTGLAYQVRVGFQEALRVYVGPDEELNEFRTRISGGNSVAAPLPESAVMRITPSDDPGNADLRVDYGEHQGEGFLKLAITLSAPMSQTMPVIRSVPLKDHSAITQVLHYATPYSWHLRRQSSRPSVIEKVKLTFTELVPSVDKFDDDLAPALMPFGENLIVDGQIKLLLDPSRYYGLKITSDLSTPLYVAAFLFDSDLSIMTYYLPSATGAGLQAGTSLPGSTTIEPGVFTIGYGNSTFPPFQYALQDGLDEDVNFLRVFVSTGYMDLEFISQETPFTNETLWKDDRKAEEDVTREARGGVRGVVRPGPGDLWGAITIPIFQSRGSAVGKSTDVGPN
ncbi:hypothetical protein BDW22DRAFT_1430173 [Trametopsis cervina]|nr:hypothetical protein BDW22DRAFT_1430173 [Trametopsis cervina]